MPRREPQRHHVGSLSQRTSTISEVRISGIEMQTMTVLRQLPEKAGSSFR
jgi:hypothetical protein